MIRYLTLDEVLEMHRLCIVQSGGLAGVRDLGLVQSAVAQPSMSFGGQELYLSIPEKAAALCFSLVMNHPFMDGNKRVGHAAMETFLVLNGFELAAPLNEQERAMLDLAAGATTPEDFAVWVAANVVRCQA